MVKVLLPILLLVPLSLRAAQKLNPQSQKWNPDQSFQQLPKDALASDAVVLPDKNTGDRVIVVQSDPTPGIPLRGSRRERENAKYAQRPEPYPVDNAVTINNWMGKMRQWELEQNMRDPEFDINNALAEFFNGSDDPTEQEELLQLQSDKSGQSIGWRYDRRDDRSWFRPLQKGESQSRWSRHTGEEN